MFTLRLHRKLRGKVTPGQLVWKFQRTGIPSFWFGTYLIPASPLSLLSVPIQINHLHVHVGQISNKVSPDLCVIPPYITLLHSLPLQATTVFYYCILVCIFQNSKQMGYYRMYFLCMVSSTQHNNFEITLLLIIQSSTIVLFSLLLLSSIHYRDMPQSVYLIMWWWHIGYFQFCPIINKLSWVSVCTSLYEHVLLFLLGINF